jgi:uncharacterized alkaline shock family protein YloU
VGQAVYHQIKNYSNFGKIGISYESIRNMIKISLSDIKNISITKINLETKEGIFIVNLAIKINYGENINNVTNVILERVESALANMCEIKNPKINVKLDGIIVK